MNQEYKAYAGIGSRSTPLHVLDMMTNFASNMEKAGWTLRSGGADGADTAFEKGVKATSHQEIFLPWRYFNENTSKRYEVSWEAMEIAKQFHPAWHNCSSAAKKLHARNVHQVLGQFLDNPSKFVLCYTPNGSGSGGTGQAIRIAQFYKIPVFDLGNPNLSIKELEDLIHSYGELS